MIICSFWNFGYCCSRWGRSYVLVTDYSARGEGVDTKSIVYPENVMILVYNYVRVLHDIFSNTRHGIENTKILSFRVIK